MGDAWLMRIIIDTDPGMGTAGADPEDGMAILYALRSPGVTVEGITLVQGNVAVSHSWPNAHRLLELAGRTAVPAARRRRRAQVARAAAPADGLAAATGRSTPSPDATSPDTPGDTAAAFLVDTVLAAPGEITIVAIGPLTNVAAALEADPGFAEALGGS